MEDRFRFRVWNNGKMYQQALVGEPTNTAVMTDEGWKESTETAIVMQCTGLKDKNGKLIFEGDVLQQFGYGSEECISMGETYGLSWYEVIFINGAFMKSWRKSEKNFYASKANFRIIFMLDNFHVVGNIHENPKLLEKND